MSAAGRWTATVAVLLFVGARSRAAPRHDRAPAAEAAAGPTLSAPAAVDIAVVGTAGDLHRVRTLFGADGLAGATPSWLRVSRFDPLDVVQEHRPPERRAVRCWVDMSSPGRIRLFFAAGSGERFLVRDLTVSARFDEMDRQTLAEVLERSVTALLDDEQAGLDRAQAQALLESRLRRETPAPAAGVVVSPSPATPPRVNVAVFYAGQALPLARPGGETVALVHGPGLSLAGAIDRPRRRWAMWAAAQLQFPNRELANDVGLQFQTTATRVGLELQQTIGDDAVRRRFRISYLMLRVGTGLDLVHLTPRPGAVDPSVVLTRPRWSKSLVFTAAAGAGLRVGRQMRLAVTVFVDVLPTTVHYDLATEGQPTPVFSAARVRPGVALELATAVF